MRRFLALAALLGLAVLGPFRLGLAAEYLETFERDADPAKVMAGNLLIGDDGVWDGALDAGGYVLSNAGKKGAARYYSVKFGKPSSDANAPRLSVAVDVAGTFDSDVAGAGLIYGHDDTKKSYYAFIVNRGSAYTLLQRGEKGLRKVASGKNEAILPDGLNRIFVQIEADRARLFVNEDQILAHSAKRAAQGKAGIFALDRGSFRFDNFRLESE